MSSNVKAIPAWELIGLLARAAEQTGLTLEQAFRLIQAYSSLIVEREDATGSTSQSAWRVQ